jgi:hypothetical protein
MGAIAAALIPAGISLVGDIIGGNSASDAAHTQANAYQNGINTVEGFNNQTRTDLMPWLTAGQSSLGGLTALLGLGGNGAQQSAINNLQSGPLFQSLYRQGTNAILGNASATGGLRGGNTEGALYNLGSDTLNQVIQNQIANLTGLSDTGFRAGGLLGQFGQDTGNSIAQLLASQGTALASGQLGSGSALASGLNGIGSLFGAGGPLAGIFGGGGGGGSVSGFDPNDMSTWDPIAGSVGF